MSTSLFLFCFFIFLSPLLHVFAPSPSLFVSPLSKELSDGRLVESLLLVKKLCNGFCGSVQQLVLHQEIDALQENGTVYVRRALERSKKKQF